MSDTPLNDLTKDEDLSVAEIEALATAYEEQMQEVDLYATFGVQDFEETASQSLDDLRQKHFVNLLKESEENQALRVKYVDKIYQLVATWLLLVAFCVFLVGAGTLELTDGVLIAFITSTTINVIGLFLVVANWLFPKRK